MNDASPMGGGREACPSRISARDVQTLALQLFNNTLSIAKLQARRIIMNGEQERVGTRWFQGATAQAVSRLFSPREWGFVWT
jgi:hypothetical protein